MGRTIKFRGKRTDNGEWVYGCLIQRIDCTEIHDGVFTWAIKPETVGQFTGLKDKNGVEIYEGDIVVCSHAGQFIRGAVINKDACYFIQFTNGQMAWIGEAVKKYKVEVLGNIHDNPEMLEL